MHRQVQGNSTTLVIVMVWLCYALVLLCSDFIRLSYLLVSIDGFSFYLHFLYFIWIGLDWTGWALFLNEFFLFYFILSCFVSFCLVLSCFILIYFVLFCFCFVYYVPIWLSFIWILLFSDWFFIWLLTIFSTLFYFTLLFSTSILGLYHLN